MQETGQINITYRKHFFETLKGNFYQEFNSSLNEIVILYANRLKKETKNLDDIDKFITNYTNSLTNSLGDYFSSIVWNRETRRVIFQWKKRVLFLVEKRKDIFVTLLLRDDFNTETAIEETTLKINIWLSSLDDVTLMQNWILENDQSKPTFENIRKYDEIIPTSNLINSPKEEKHFWQILNGKNDEERKELFDFVISKLLDKYIIQIDSNTYKWIDESKGSGKYIGGLIHVLDKNKYLQVLPPSKTFANIISQWLRHSHTLATLAKELERGKLSEYAIKREYKIYIEDFEEYFPSKRG